MAKEKTSASKEKKGVSGFETTHPNSITAVQQKRKATVNLEQLVEGILESDIASLSRAITIVESKSEAHYKWAKTIIKKCLPHANKSIRLGITGVPGVGKSTFTEAIGKHLTKKGKRVAVLAIDPSSTINKGSILGDKTRMASLANDENAFIRPSASGESLGGVARKTRETILLCEAAGFDIIIIETVGVGQSETTVHSMVDFFLLLKLAGAGDELQGIKRGIIEMADAIAINKADGNNIKPAKIALAEFKRALELYPQKTSGLATEVLLCSAINNDGINEIWNHIFDYIESTKKSGVFDVKRHQQNEYWLIQHIEEQLKSRFFDNKKIKAELKLQLELLKENKTTPFVAADYLLSLK